MDELTIEQYEVAIKELIPRHIEALQVLYGLPNSSATAKQLAALIHPDNPAAITASGRIGRIGKAIAKHHDITPTTYLYNSIPRPAFFRIVSQYYYKDIGWTLNNHLKKALENLKLVSPELLERLPTEALQFEERQLYREGKVTKVFVDRFERSQQARLKCISYYGTKCQACDIDFGSVYGEEAKGYIHVHHKTPLHEINEEYIVDAVKDLIPLCPNCHAVTHLIKPAMSLDKLKSLLKKGKVK